MDVLTKIFILFRRNLKTNQNQNTRNRPVTQIGKRKKNAKDQRDPKERTSHLVRVYQIMTMTTTMMMMTTKLTMTKKALPATYRAVVEKCRTVGEKGTWEKKNAIDTKRTTLIVKLEKITCLNLRKNPIKFRKPSNATERRIILTTKLLSRYVIKGTFILEFKTIGVALSYIYFIYS